MRLGQVMMLTFLDVAPFRVPQQVMSRLMRTSIRTLIGVMRLKSP